MGLACFVLDGLVARIVDEVGRVPLMIGMRLFFSMTSKISMY